MKPEHLARYMRWCRRQRRTPTFEQLNRFKREGLFECADQVFSCVKIHSGFSAYRRVNHSK